MAHSLKPLADNFRGQTGFVTGQQMALALDNIALAIATAGEPDTVPAADPVQIEPNQPEPEAEKPAPAEQVDPLS